MTIFPVLLPCYNLLPITHDSMYVTFLCSAPLISTSLFSPPPPFVYSPSPYSSIIRISPHPYHPPSHGHRSSSTACFYSYPSSLSRLHVILRVSPPSIPSFYFVPSVCLSPISDPRLFTLLEFCSPFLSFSLSVPATQHSFSHVALPVCIHTS